MTFFMSKGFSGSTRPSSLAATARERASYSESAHSICKTYPETELVKSIPQDFFGGDAYLTVTGQLAVESYCLSMSKVYTFGPTFRAENSNTSRHLAEFWMVEPEIAFADLKANADQLEALLKYVSARVLDRCETDLGFFQQRIDNTVLERLSAIVDKPFITVSYTDAIDILKQSGKRFEFPVAGASIWPRSTSDSWQKNTSRHR